MKIYQAKIGQLLLSTLLCISLCLSLATICSGVVYEYIELLPEGWTSSTASRINNNGAVFGGVSNSNTSKLFI